MGRGMVLNVITAATFFDAPKNKVRRSCRREKQINVQEHVSTHDRRGRMPSPHWGELRSYPGAAG